MSSYNIALIPGDGIGPEIVGQAVRVLEAAAAEESPLTTQETRYVPTPFSEKTFSATALPASMYPRY